MSDGRNFFREPASMFGNKVEQKIHNFSIRIEDYENEKRGAWFRRLNLYLYWILINLDKGKNILEYYWKNTI